MRKAVSVMIGKILIFLGLTLVAAGFLFILIQKGNVSGRLPGDVLIRKGNATFYFPVVTCLVLSVLMTLLFNLFGRK